MTAKKRGLHHRLPELTEAEKDLALQARREYYRGYMRQRYANNPELQKEANLLLPKFYFHTA